MALPQLFVLGDSISMQYGPYLERMVAGRFRYRRKVDPAGQADHLEVPAGANGGDSSAVLAYLRWLQARGDFRPELFLLNCGLHDVKTQPGTDSTQVPLAQYRANLQQIIALIREAGVRTVWARTTPVDDQQHNGRKIDFHRFDRDVVAYNAAADALMTAAGIPLLDLNGFTRSLDAPLYCDHVHFVEPVRQLQAAYIAGYLAGMPLLP